MPSTVLVIPGYKGSQPEFWLGFFWERGSRGVWTVRIFQSTRHGIPVTMGGFYKGFGPFKTYALAREYMTLTMETVFPGGPFLPPF